MISTRSFMPYFSEFFCFFEFDFDFSFFSFFEIDFRNKVFSESDLSDFDKA